MKPHERYHIDQIRADGEPIAPAKHAKIFVRQCGVVVRDNVPITVQEWHKTKVDGVSYVDDQTKEMLWTKLMVNFTLPPEVDPEDNAIERKVKAWALKKMAVQFKDFKKRLNLDYVEKGLTPDFKGATEKIKNHWDEFVRYKTSEAAKKRSKINKINAGMKKYHHRMGSSGYRGVIAKMEKEEADLDALRIPRDTQHWPRRSKLWFYGMGGSLDPQTGKCVFSKKNTRNTHRSP